jgi:hypothetical protein
MDWDTLTSNLVKAEIKRHGYTYEQLCEKLERIGVHETVGALKGKLNRGRFTAVFLLQVIKALNIRVMHFDMLYNDQRTDITSLLPKNKQDKT